MEKGLIIKVDMRHKVDAHFETTVQDFRFDYCELLHELGLTTNDVADRLGCSRKEVADMLGRLEPTVRDLVTLVTALKGKVRILTVLPVP